MHSRSFLVLWVCCRFGGGRGGFEQQQSGFMGGRGRFGGVGMGGMGYGGGYGMDEGYGGRHRC